MICSLSVPLLIVLGLFVVYGLAGSLSRLWPVVRLLWGIAALLGLLQAAASRGILPPLTSVLCRYSWYDEGVVWLLGIISMLTLVNVILNFGPAKNGT